MRHSKLIFLNGCHATKSVYLHILSYSIVRCMHLLSFGMSCSLLVPVVAQTKAYAARCALRNLMLIKLVASLPM